MANKTSPAPSGLAIVRNGNKFEFSWKIPSTKYGAGQQLQWHIKVNGTWLAWNTVSVGTTVTRKTVSVSASSYYPSTSDKLDAIIFRVRGKRETADGVSYDYSDWSQKSYDVMKPAAPVVTATLSSTYSNETTFSWTVANDAKEKKWFTNTEYQTILVKNCSETNGAKLKWKTTATGWATGTSSAPGSYTKREDSTALASASYTRWVRVRSRGPQGASDWKYSKHVYAKPNQANVKKVSVKQTNSTGYNVKVTWEAASTAANPIDKTTVQYDIIVPASNLEHPSSNTGWRDAVVIGDTKGNDAASFVTNALLAVDQCLYVRVNNMHDTAANTNYGVATLAKIGKLKNPSNVSVSLNSSTYTATVTATNNSTVPDSFLAVVYRRKTGKDYVVGIIPHGSSSVACHVPSWTSATEISFGVYACVGSYIQKTRADGTDAYAVTKKMTSEDTIWTTGDVPKAPSSVTVAAVSGTTDTVRVAWNWSWASADSAVLAWADHEDAWESTDEPEMYTVENTDATAWNISGLEPGKTWYVAVRLVSEDVQGPWSNIQSIDLSSPPVKPTLFLSSATITEQSKFAAYWTYVSTDDTSQAYATIVNTTVSGSTITRGAQIGYAETAQSATLQCPADWTAGNQYYLSMKVTSASGHESEWSDPVPITVADPISCTITQNSFSTVTISSTEGSSTVTRTVTSLTAMPLTVTATGAGAGGTTTVVIERAEDYHVMRPDESQFNGYEGETIAMVSQTGESQVTIKNNMLFGNLDDGAAYKLIVTAEDSFGQVASSTIDFEVHWSHQAVEPTATVTMDGAVAKIRSPQPSGYASGDVCDIYRLSVDAPMLVVNGGTFGTYYVDPYPAIGVNGGYRVVFRTANGDYVTTNGTMAWCDVYTGFNTDYSIIDFGNDQIQLPFNLTYANTWTKDFKETQYLGGSVQGDWNPSVSRTLNMGTALVTVKYEDAITLMRRLAVYPGICHVRTPDGSSFDADIEVTESRSYEKGRIVDFALAITRVDPEGYAGMTLTEWEAM